jgi:hypothetical protein
MPLLDHFHPPFASERSWESFHAAWLGSLADALNRQLPAGYFAEEQTHAGTSPEIDVATFERTTSVAVAQGAGTTTATLPATQVCSPPLPALTIPAVFADDFEIRVFATGAGLALVAAIELVSPRNKDRPEARRAFAVKCASYLYQSISLIVIDIVTERRAILHHEILPLLGVSEATPPPGSLLYAVGYRPIRRQGQEQIDIWPAGLEIAAALPTLPLALNADLCLPVDLEATYMDARRRRRLA